MKTRWVWLFLVMVLAVISPALAQEVTPEAPPSIAELSAMFDYDQTSPLDVQEVGVKDQDGIAVHDITFASPVADTDPVSAYLVVPPGDGPFAGVLFVHWLGSPKGNRDEFLDDAITLAHQGAVSVLVNAGWSKGGFWNRDIQHDHDVSVKQVVDLRRGLDVLLAQPNVDADRLALVGHDFGAMYGGLVAGVDHRLKAAVLMAGTTSLSDWFVPYGQGTRLTGDARTQYIAAMSVFDPTLYVAEAKPTNLLFQFSRTDQFISEETELAFYQAASKPRRLELYDSDHSLRSQDVTDARMAWLTKQLKLQASS